VPENKSTNSPLDGAPDSINESVMNPRSLVLFPMYFNF
jgi:hypothetical protein